MTRTRLVYAVNQLARRDIRLGLIVGRLGPPPLWARPAAFATLILIILEQQVSLASARAAFTRLHVGVGQITPDNLGSRSTAEIRACGITRQKAGYCLELATAINSGRLNLQRLGGRSDDDARADLCQIKGIGPWTANIYLMMALRRPDIWPCGDLALAESYREIAQMRSRPGKDTLARIAKRWSPWRSVAARILWHHYLRGSGISG